MSPPEQSQYTFFENAAKYSYVPDEAFHWTNAWWASELSYLVYSTDEGYIRKQLNSAGMDVRFYFDPTITTQAMVAWNSDLAFVVFRGTQIDRLLDWAADADLFPLPSSEGFVHSGFRRALHMGSVWNNVQILLGSMKVQKHVAFTGHSLGAALATLAATEYNDPAHRPEALYTFGSPRVGDPVLFAQTCAKLNAYRVVNNRDIITHVPTPPAFAHVGRRFQFGPGNDVVDQNDWDDVKTQLATLAVPFALPSFARRGALHEYFDTLLRSNIAPLVDHAPRIYSTKIWNRMITDRT